MLENDDHIEFKALTPGLGFKHPKAIPDIDDIGSRIPSVKISQIKKSDIPKPYKSFLLDQLFILSMVILFGLIPLWQFPLNHDKNGFIFLPPRILCSFGFLWAVMMSFYFMFFNHFKIPSLGKLLFK